jgi:hypothetical protein
VRLADTPVFDSLWARYPHTTLLASGEAVGLPPGQMGNSEVGHLTIGSGRVIFQDLMRVNKAIESGALFENPALSAAFRRAAERGTNVHLLGLVSYGGVHSHIDHLRAPDAGRDGRDAAGDLRRHRRGGRAPLSALQLHGDRASGRGLSPSGDRHPLTDDRAVPSRTRRGW